MDTKLLIIGGVAGGATAAARARRLNERAKIIILERGEHISFANCGLPYYIGGIIKSRDNLLVTTPEAFQERYNVEVRIHAEVLTIDTTRRQVLIRNINSEQVYSESYDTLILAPGAEPIRPPIPGADLEGVFHLRDIPDSDRIKNIIGVQKPKSAVVVGGGFIGLEMAENLVIRGIETTVLEMGNQVMAPLDAEMASIVQAHLRHRGVNLALGDGVKSIVAFNGRLRVTTQEGKVFDCDLVISAIGVTPENRLAKEAGLKLGPRGHIQVDATMRTSDPHIYAVGDAVEIKDFVTGFPTTVALAGPANKQGRIAADNAMGRRSIYRGALGTSIVKVFDLAVASTGSNEKILMTRGIPFLVSYTHSGSHASYYPGSSPMAIKLIFSPSSGNLLGAQIVGVDGVDKRIDVLSTAIHAGMTVFDLEQLELAYAPPFSSAKDPVNMAGFVASNVLKDDLDVTHWHELADLVANGSILLDLRGKEEIRSAGDIPGSINIPLDKLREELPNLDKDKDYIPYCAVGMRGYLAHRILIQNGFKSRNLSGGYRTFTGAREEIMRESPEAKIWLSE